MAEILVRVKDKINPLDFYKNCQCTKRGDVIVASPDGWPWGKDELSDPQYRIFKLPNVSLATAQSFLAPEKDSDPKNPSRTLQRRAVKFDIDNPAFTAVKTVIDDDTRTQKTASIAFSDSAVLALKVIKSPVADPTIIGDPTPNVIG